MSTTRSTGRPGAAPPPHRVPIRRSSSAAGASGSCLRRAGRPTSSGINPDLARRHHRSRGRRPTPLPRVRRAGRLGPGRGRRALRPARAPGSDLPGQVVPNGREALAQMAPLFGASPEAMAEIPIALVGTVDEISETLQSAARASWGFNYVVIHEAGSRPSPRWSPVSPAPEGGPGTAHRGLRRNVRPHPRRPSGGGGGRPTAPSTSTGLLLVVANEPWQKEGPDRSPRPRTACAMVEAAVGDRPGLEASAGDRPGWAVLHRGHRRSAPRSLPRGPSCSWWWGRTWCPTSRPGITKQPCRSRWCWWWWTVRVHPGEAPAGMERRLGAGPALRRVEHGAQSPTGSGRTGRRFGA